MYINCKELYKLYKSVDNIIQKAEMLLVNISFSAYLWVRLVNAIDWPVRIPNLSQASLNIQKPVSLFACRHQVMEWIEPDNM